MLCGPDTKEPWTPSSSPFINRETGRGRRERCHVPGKRQSPSSNTALPSCRACEQLPATHLPHQPLSTETKGERWPRQKMDSEVRLFSPAPKALSTLLLWALVYHSTAWTQHYRGRRWTERVTRAPGVNQAVRRREE